jgi:hypothetical protein
MRSIEDLFFFSKLFAASFGVDKGHSSSTRPNMGAQKKNCLNFLASSGALDWTKYKI